MEKKEYLSGKRANVTVRPSTEIWLKFKGLFTMQGKKRDDAITEALTDYVKKHKGAL